MKRKILMCSTLAALGLLAAGCSDRIGYAGEDLTGQVSIERDNTTKEPSVSVSTPGNWSIYGGPAVERIYTKEALLTGTQPGTYPLPGGNTERSYYMFANGKNKTILAERHLPMEGGYNFRDLGGYRTTDGRYTKWGVIFRSDDLHTLTAEDLHYLRSIPINSIVDFRATAEAAMAPDQLPSPATRHYALPISPGDMSTAGQFADITEGQMSAFMEQMNVQFVTTPEFIAQWREFFRLLQDPSNIPLMFHCSAGKDRTGMAAALILFALGVDEETIYADYLLSNQYIIDKYAAYIEQQPALLPLFSVRREFLQAGIERIKQDHGSVSNFLANQLEVDIPLFRQRYLF